MQNYSTADAKKINVAMSCILLFGTLASYIDAKYGRGSGSYYLTQTIYFLSMLAALPSAIKCINRKIVIFAISFFIVFLVSYAIGKDTNVFHLVERNILLWCMPYLLFSFSVRDHKDLVIKLKYVSLFVLIIGYLRMFTLNFSSETYSQELGYDVLLPFIIYFLLFLKEHKSWYIVPIAVSYALMLMSGSRGPLMCAVMGGILACVIINRVKIKNIMLYATIGCAVYIPYYLHRIEILTWVSDCFTSLNVSNRAVEMLLYNEISRSEGRDRLREIALDYILNHPFVGSGVVNDRPYLYGQYLINRTATVYGTYCHNFFLEIMMQFGLVLGVILIAAYFYSIVSKVKNADAIEKKEYWIILLTIGFFPLLVSRSWITFHVFYMVIGALLASDFETKERKWAQ